MVLFFVSQSGTHLLSYAKGIVYFVGKSKKLCKWQNLWKQQTKTHDFSAKANIIGKLMFDSKQ